MVDGGEGVRRGFRERGEEGVMARVQREINGENNPFLKGLGLYTPSLCFQVTYMWLPDSH